MSDIVRTTAGQLAGTTLVTGIRRFAGVPYAAAPVGPRRFRATQPQEGWAGLRDATEFGPVCPQPPSPLDMLLSGRPEPQSEDCLLLNVWTPGCDGAGRPVMVWIHGGAFVQGSGSSPVYDGARLASRGNVVVVTINYRLGELGWLRLDELGDEFAGSANNGLRDQVTALRWVQDNIASFGGDPGHVTVFGESAGAMSISSLLGAPLAAGLFQRAITQSGSANVHLSVDTAIEVAADYCRRAGVAKPEDLLDLVPERLLAVQSELAAAIYSDLDASMTSGRPGGLSFAPVVDGVVLFEPPLAAVARGAAKDISLLAGTTADEWRLFQTFDRAPSDDASLLALLGRLLPEGPEREPDIALGLYRDAYPGLAPRELKAAILTDQFFTGPARQMAAAQNRHRADTRVYRFSWPSPAMGGVFGACHALELPFMWGTFDLTGLAMFVGANPPAALSATMMDAWLSFARCGDPNHSSSANWPAYSEADPAVFDFGETSQLQPAPGPATLDLWR